MLTTHLLTKNNEVTIRRALNTLKPLQCEILVGDLGSTDNTLNICQEFGCKIYSLEGIQDYSLARNTLIAKSTNDWQFYLEPWEGLVNGYQDLQELTGDMFYVTIVQSEIATRSIRLFNKKCGAHFIRPCYENIDPEINPKHSNIIIGAETVSNQDYFNILAEWKRREPTASEPDYYLACAHLMHHNYDKFLQLAEHYLFKETLPTTPVIMTHYYCALVQAHVKRNTELAIKHLIKCLIVKPLMAEFWCALGDIYFSLNQKDRALAFYENALILGSRRLKTDTWPVEIAKYDTYPQQMIKAME